MPGLRVVLSGNFCMSLHIGAFQYQITGIPWKPRSKQNKKSKIGKVFVPSLDAATFI